MKKTLFILVAAILFGLNSFASIYPVPTGPYMVGTTTFVAVDESRGESFTEVEGDKRKLLVRAWYPANVNGEERVPYIDEYHKEMYNYNFMIPMDELEAPGLSNSFIDAQPVKSEERYPVVIYAHGLGSFERDNIHLMEELASHGYIVYSINYPFLSDQAIIDGQTFEYIVPRPTQEQNVQFYVEADTLKKAIHAATTAGEKQRLMAAYNKTAKKPQFYDRYARVMYEDTLFFIESLKSKESNNQLVNSLKNSSDLNNIGMLGYSFGGGTTTLLSVKEGTPLKAGINLDGLIFPPAANEEVHGFEVKIPFLYMSSLRNSEDLTYVLMEPYFYGAEKEAYHLTLRDSGHNNFSYFGYLPTIKAYGMAGKIDDATYTYIMRETIVPFFNSVLKDNGKVMSNSDLKWNPAVIYKERNIK